ncbi:MAG: hypothetical protein JWQ38_3108 [Flavipsychrobacter sp.]|nr:hypothetical protein [Flavipsychrobacter sp.]
MKFWNLHRHFIRRLETSRSPEMYSEMTKKLLIIFLFVCVCCRSQAQTNYVLNPGLEQYSKCPDKYDQIVLAKYWSGIDTVWTWDDDISTEPLCLPEYCNVCSKTSYCGIPFAKGYYQYPRTGNGMAEVIMLEYGKPTTIPDMRDYLQGRLFKTLTAGKAYCVTFYVNLANRSGYAIDHIGAFLDDGTIDTNGKNSCSTPQTKANPQVVATSIISDTLGWTKVQGSFTANGTEKFITIGNFSDTAHTNRVLMNTDMELASLYLIDDVSVIESNAVANAGPDGLVSPGSDSAYIGTHDEGMPCTWYIKGSTTPIGYSGGFKVHPDVTTSYVVEMDLCGNVTYDTVVVRVGATGITSPSFGKGSRQAEVLIYPNPAGDVIHVNGLALTVHYRLLNIVGAELQNGTINAGNNTLSVKDMPKGIYLLEIADPSDGLRVIKRLIKE